MSSVNLYEKDIPTDAVESRMSKNKTKEKMTNSNMRKNIESEQQQPHWHQGWGYHADRARVETKLCMYLETRVKVKSLNHSLNKLKRKS